MEELLFSLMIKFFYEFKEDPTGLALLQLYLFLPFWQKHFKDNGLEVWLFHFFIGNGVCCFLLTPTCVLFPSLMSKIASLPEIYWVGQKVHSDFSITPYGKTQMNLLAIPVFLSSFFYEEECSYSEASMCQAQYVLF